MKIGDDVDGHGRYGVLDEDDGLLCHECGRRFAHLGLHAWKGLELTAAGHRQAPCPARSLGLVVSATRVAAGAARRSHSRGAVPSSARLRSAWSAGSNS